MKFRLRCEHLETRDNPSGGFNPFPMVDPITGQPYNGGQQSNPPPSNPPPSNPTNPHQPVNPTTGQPVEEDSGNEYGGGEF